MSNIDIKEKLMESKSFLGSVASFKTAYPEIKTLQLKGTQNGEVSSESQHQIYYSEKNLPQNIPCSNPRCKQGGFNLLATLITLAHSKIPSYEATFYCGGHEGTPKGRVRGDSCFNSLTFKIEATYHEK